MIAKRLLVFWMVMIIIMRDINCSVLESNFFASSICDVNARISNGCSKLEKRSGIIWCAMTCARYESCIGASLDSTGSCYIHHECGAVSGCVTMATDHVYMSKTCANGGEWEPSNQRCQCANGWVGSTCQKYPTKCLDLIHANNLQDVVKTKLDIYGDGSYLIDVFCRRQPTWYQTLALLNSGEKDFNKTWEEYRDGFYIDDNHFWIGLKHMRALNTIGEFKQMTLTIFFHVGTETFRRLADADISDQNSRYFLTYSSDLYHGTSSTGYTLRNCWSSHKNQPFSAWNMDNDDVIQSNCAANAGSGWWFTDCNPDCNLFGWALHYSPSKPAASIIKLSGIDMNDQGSNIKTIELGLHD